jgi:hypothetical protein
MPHSGVFSVMDMLSTVVKAFMFEGVDHSVLHDIVVVTEDSMGHWQRMRPWRKAHNITVHALASPQRQQDLKKLGGITGLHRNNETQWNSDYIMIQSMLHN